MWPSNFKSEPYELKRTKALYNFYQGSPNRKLNRSKNIYINDVRVVQEDAMSATLEISYTINPEANFGKLAAGAALRKESEPIGSMSMRPGLIDPSSSKTQVTLKLAAAEQKSKVKADAVQIEIYNAKGNRLHEEHFHYERAWCKKPAYFIEFASPCR